MVKYIIISLIGIIVLSGILVIISEYVHDRKYYKYIENIRYALMNPNSDLKTFTFKYRGVIFNISINSKIRNSFLNIYEVLINDEVVATSGRTEKLFNNYYIAYEFGHIQREIETIIKHASKEANKRNSEKLKQALRNESYFKETVEADHKKQRGRIAPNKKDESKIGG